MINKVGSKLFQYVQDRSGKVAGKFAPKSKAANASSLARAAKKSGVSHGHTLSSERPSQRTMEICAEARNRMRVSSEKYVEWKAALNSRNVGDGFAHAMLLVSKEKWEEESKALSRIVEESGPSDETERKRIELEISGEMIDRELKRTEPAFHALEGIHDVKDIYKQVKAEIRSLRKASDGKKLDGQAKRDIKVLKDISKKLRGEIKRLDKLIDVRKSFFSKLVLP